MCLSKTTSKLPAAIGLPFGTALLALGLALGLAPGTAALGFALGFALLLALATTGHCFEALDLNVCEFFEYALFHLFYFFVFLKKIRLSGSV